MAVVRIFYLYQYSLEQERVAFFENYRARIFIFQRTPKQNGSLSLRQRGKTPYAGLRRRIFFGVRCAESAAQRLASSEYIHENTHGFHTGLVPRPQTTF